MKLRGQPKPTRNSASTRGHLDQLKKPRAIKSARGTQLPLKANQNASNQPQPQGFKSNNLANRLPNVSGVDDKENPNPTTFSNLRS